MIGRRPVRKLLTLALLAGAAIAALATLWVQDVASRRRGTLERLVRELHAEALARDGRRPVLYGETLPGNAWTDYSAALDDMSILKKKEREILFNTWSKRPGGDEAAIRTLVRDHAVAFDRLREGAHRTLGDFPCDWENGLRRKVLDRFDVELLGRLAACRARFLAAEGKLSEPVEAILDLFQLARDLSSNSVSTARQASSSLWSIALVELKEMVFSEEYLRRDLTGLEEAMERLDRGFPAQAPILQNDALCLGYELLKPADASRLSALEIGRLECWRYAFSKQIIEADAFERIVAAVRKAAVVEDRPANELRASWKSSYLEAGRPDNPLIWHFWNQRLTVSSFGTRFERAMLRLLRVAAHYRSTGEVLELDDPLGDRLRHSIRGSDLRVWSVGGDGVDDDGHNDGLDWSRLRPVPVPGRRNPFPRDVVLEIER
jgi:hypothetical protein